MLTVNQAQHAASCLKRVANRTPLLASDKLNELLGVRVVCKAENLQRTNAFKFRGAYYHIASLPPASYARGVIAASSGNHAQGVALSAQIFGTQAAVVVPSDLPAFKLHAIRQYGADVFYYDRFSDDRNLLVAELATTLGYTVVPSSESTAVLAGNGTIALEILEEVPDLESLIVPVGGGGLAAGCATVIKALSPKTKVIGVEPDTGNDTQLSLKKGYPVVIPAPKTIADGLRHSTPAPSTFEINRRLLDDVVTVDDADILNAMALCWHYLEVVIEPSGACALAALTKQRATCGLGQIAVVLSGGNIEKAAFKSLIKSYTI